MCAVVLPNLNCPVPPLKRPFPPSSVISSSCTGETIEQALIYLGREELAGMIDKQATTEVRCEF